ncbi:hypothetical protein LCI18_002398 [Fusarium solani-melongenae]|uniref:Uncharacterized protein n=1 Tax=Fusarium solani subsp. cucurbitae TaxID=2747967 RepID=A0ACD3YR78_FUSSC|nr:hypothetical protein LCI18_002398 [Fusarium solani-melongenae]
MFRFSTIQFANTFYLCNLGHSTWFDTSKLIPILSISRHLMDSLLVPTNTILPGNRKEFCVFWEQDQFQASFTIPVMSPWEQATPSLTDWETDHSSGSKNLPQDTFLPLERPQTLNDNGVLTHHPKADTSLDSIACAARLENSRSSTSTSVPEDDEAFTSSSQHEKRHSGRSDVKLRSASRKPKRSTHHKRPSHKSGIRARECHNLVEKLYRNRLKAQFEALLAVLPVSQPLDCTRPITGNAQQGQYFSRGQVLDAARERILELEKEIEQGTAVRDGLQSDLECLRWAHQEAGLRVWPVE